jgi:hypothetical protein
VVTICTTRFNILKLYPLPTECIYVFRTVLTINCGCFPKHPMKILRSGTNCLVVFVNNLLTFLHSFQYSLHYCTISFITCLPASRSLFCFINVHFIHQIPWIIESVVRSLYERIFIQLFNLWFNSVTKIFCNSFACSINFAEHLHSVCEPINLWN